VINLISLIDALSDYGIRYLVAGGVAVTLHGVERSTVDLDLIIDFDPDNIKKFMNVLKVLGYRPKIPVKPELFADPIKRNEWIKKKGMVVFSFCHKDQMLDVIDIFVYHPRPFIDMEKRRKNVKAGRFVIPIVSIDDLIFMKKEAGRKQDLADIRVLNKIKRFQKKGK